MRKYSALRATFMILFVFAAAYAVSNPATEFLWVRCLIAGAFGVGFFFYEELR